MFLNLSWYLDGHQCPESLITPAMDTKQNTLLLQLTANGLNSLSVVPTNLMRTTWLLDASTTPLETLTEPTHAGEAHSWLDPLTLP